MKRHLSAVLATSMILATLTACGSTDSSTGNTPSINPTDDRGLNTSGENLVTFPLDEALTYNYHYHASNKYTFNPEWPVYQEMANITNITFVNTSNPVATNTANELALQAVDQFPHDLYGGGVVGDYAMQYGPYGAFYSLDDYWEYLPNYSAYLAENPDVVASTASSDGKIYHIPYIADGTVARTYFIRQDWLDNLNLEMPETVEDLEKVLIAFRDDDPNGNGLNDEIPVIFDYWQEIIRLVNFWDARCFSNDDRSERVVLGDDGVWYHTWLTDEFKVGLENISRWYDIGLIDKEAFTKGTSARKEYIPGDVAGMVYEWVASTSSYNDSVAIDGFNFVVMAPPVTEAGNQWSEHVRTKVTTEGWAVSTSCDESKVGELFAFMDYFFSEEGRILTNFGIEGEHWTLVDGKPTFTDSVMNNTASKAVNTYLKEDIGAQLPIGYWMDYDYEFQWTNEVGRAGVTMYVEGGFSDDLFMLPSLNYTDDELETHEALRNEINTYHEEAMQDFILGDWTLVDGKWDAYVAKTESLGVQELIDLYATAYERYISYFN
ncbi:MAG: hypothetical protein R3Y12_06730 [Clostridia bacterium]